MMKNGTAALLVGRTVMPFASQSVISFLVISPADRTLKQESALLDHAFQSFRLLSAETRQ